MRTALSIVAKPYRYFLSVVNRDLRLTQPEYRKLLADGWEEVGERGGNLWELYRGFRYNCRIVDARITPDGMSLLVKIVDCYDRA
jgi:hypothetical protein